MRRFHDINDPDISTCLLESGAIGVLRTDTLYGVVARAHDDAAVERVYRLKGRTPTKPPIVLIGSIEQLFDQPGPEFIERIKGYWPGRVSLILPAPSAPQWLSRGTGTVAYRLPADEPLRRLLERTGPLIAPSANPEGEAPAGSIEAAYAYFGDRVDVYVDEGSVATDTPASMLIRLHEDGRVEHLR